MSAVWLLASQRGERLNKPLPQVLLTQLPEQAVAGSCYQHGGGLFFNAAAFESPTLLYRTLMNSTKPDIDRIVSLSVVSALSSVNRYLLTCTHGKSHKG